MSTDCASRRGLLSEGPFCKVEQCGCGTIHLSLGPFTLRLHPDVVESIWRTLGEALGQQPLTPPLSRVMRERAS